MGSPLAGDVRTQLARILASEIFSRSDRLTAFLTFIVEQTLEGRGGVLKEHVLAIEVYGKTSDFDAGLDLPAECRPSGSRIDAPDVLRVGVGWRLARFLQGA